MLQKWNSSAGKRQIMISPICRILKKKMNKRNTPKDAEQADAAKGDGGEVANGWKEKQITYWPYI